MVIISLNNRSLRQYGFVDPSWVYFFMFSVLPLVIVTGHTSAKAQQARESSRHLHADAVFSFLQSEGQLVQTIPKHRKSQFSPLNPGSPMFPDGMIHPQYTNKVKTTPMAVVNVTIIWESTMGTLG
jgi:hypothetical protein